MKIYACYRNIKNLPEGDLEFWSINKHLYDAYVSLFAKYLLSSDFRHEIMPIKAYDTMNKFHSASMLQMFEPGELYFNDGFSVISTINDIDIIDPIDCLVELLGVPSIPPEIFNYLPKRIMCTFRGTKFHTLLTTDGGSCGDGISEIIEPDYFRLFYVARCCYYSGLPLIDILS